MLKGRKAWSSSYDACLLCGGTHYPHKGKGYCYVCYPRKFRGILCDYIPRLSWSRHYSACVVCGETDEKHLGHGYCASCYNRRRMQKSKEVMKQKEGKPM